MPTLTILKNPTGVTWRGNEAKDNPDLQLGTDPAHPPRAAYYNGSVFVVWKSMIYRRWQGWVSDDAKVEFALFDPSTLSMKGSAVILGNVRCYESPTLVVFKDKLFLVYKGSNENRLWYHVYNPQTGNFGSGSMIDGILANKNYGVVSAAMFGGELILFLYDWGTYNVRGYKAPNLGEKFTALPAPPPTIRTWLPLSAVSYQGLVHLFVMAPTKDKLYGAKYDGKNWLGAFEIPYPPSARQHRGKSDGGVDAVVQDGLLQLTFRRGSELAFQTYDGISFRQQMFMAGVYRDTLGTRSDCAALVPTSVSTPKDGIISFYANTWETSSLAPLVPAGAREVNRQEGPQ